MPERDLPKTEALESHRPNAPKVSESLDGAAHQLDESLRKSATFGETEPKTAEEKNAFDATTSKYRLSPDQQKMVFNTLASGATADALKFFGEVTLVKPDESATKLPDNFEVSKAKLDLSKAGQYFGYEKAAGGTTKVTIKIPSMPGGLQISGLRTEEGDFGGQIKYEIPDTKTTVTVEAGEGDDDEVSALGRIEQGVGKGLLTATILYNGGKVTGVIDYKNPNTSVSLTIKDDSVDYAATFNVSLRPNVVLSGKVGGQVPFEGDMESPTASLAVKADLGKGGSLSAEAYAKKGTGDNADRQDFGGTVSYELPL